jgi:hypothetical protein
LLVYGQNEFVEVGKVSEISNGKMKHVVEVDGKEEVLICQCRW